MSSILMTTVFYNAVILQGENWRWSLLGLKGLTDIMTDPIIIQTSNAFNFSKLMTKLKKGHQIDQYMALRKKFISFTSCEFH